MYLKSITFLDFRYVICGVFMAGFPCATCFYKTFIKGKIDPWLQLFLCNSCHAPMCFSCFADFQKFAILQKENLCQYCAHRLDFNNGNKKEYKKVFQSNILVAIQKTYQFAKSKF